MLDLVDLYESPINVTIQRVSESMDKVVSGAVMQVTQQIGVNVNEEELIKALRYDRDQYRRGFSDGLRASERHGHWIDACGMRKGRYDVYGKGDYQCSCCRAVSFLAVEDDFCRKCGARMDQEAPENE